MRTLKTKIKRPVTLNNIIVNINFNKNKNKKMKVYLFDYVLIAY